MADSQLGQSERSRASARLTVYLDLNLEGDAARMSADELMEAMQELRGTAIVNVPDAWGEIVGVEVGSCAISREWST